MAEKYDLQEREVWDGNFAASQALRQVQVDVVSAYPITPSTPIVENYGNYVANGYVDGEFVMVESEHAAMSACVGAGVGGAGGGAAVFRAKADLLRYRASYQKKFKGMV